MKGAQLAMTVSGGAARAALNRPGFIGGLVA